MDIAGISTALSQMRIASQTSTAVLDKTLDMNEALGAQMVDMIEAAAMEHSVNPAVGGNLDLRI